MSFNWLTIGFYFTDYRAVPLLGLCGKVKLKLHAHKFIYTTVLIEWHWANQQQKKDMTKQKYSKKEEKKK